MASMRGKRLKYLRDGFTLLEMTEEFDTRQIYVLKYVGNNVDMWEMAEISGKWLKYLTNGLINWEMTQRFGKWLKHLGNGVDIWVTA